MFLRYQKYKRIWGEAGAALPWLNISIGKIYWEKES